jgi:multidrug efflux system membrane fusion protein
MDMAAAALQRAEATLSRAAVQVKRIEPLVDADAISRQSYDDAVAQRDQAAAEVAQARTALARRQLDLKFATVDAPISGRIDQALVTEGALVGSADASPMARVQQIDQVYVDVRQPSSTLESLRQISSAPSRTTGDCIPVPLLRSDGRLYDLQGCILFSAITVDAGTGGALLRILVDNPKRELLPGMFVRARVPHANYAAALSVPQQAVIRIEGKPQVWIVDAKNQTHLAPVELGELIDRRYRIQAGIEAGQKIVVEGTDRLTDGAAVAPSDWQRSESRDGQAMLTTTKH